MPRHGLSWASWLLGLVVLVSFAPLVALAGDDTPRSTISRPVPNAPKRELILLVGGLDSYASDSAWDPVIARFSGDPRYEVRRFGALEEHPYRTNGSVEANARELVSEIRDLSPRYSAIHMISHSMGGPVVDRAFANGLSRSDGVRTYVALSAPHSGSTSARVAEALVVASGDARPEVHALWSWAHDPHSDAVRELAHLKAAEPPNGVTRLDLRLATDAVVLHDDARAPGVDSRTLLPRRAGEVIEGHGTILSDPRALDLAKRTIATGVPPKDDRGLLLTVAARVVDALVAQYALAMCLCLAVLTLYCARSLRPWRPLLRR
ncbi:MAG: hypothetical protein HY071_04920 [Chloroflexi bacterium]|nr:hypothetical protein [Chloroflexota bacterium]